MEEEKLELLPKSPKGIEKKNALRTDHPYIKGG